MLSFCFKALISGLRNPALDLEKKEAKQRSMDNMTQYVNKRVGLPIEKLRVCTTNVPVIISHIWYEKLFDGYRNSCSGVRFCQFQIGRGGLEAMNAMYTFGCLRWILLFTSKYLVNFYPRD